MSFVEKNYKKDGLGECDGYSIKLRNKIKSAYDKNQLPSVGGKYDGKVLKSQQIVQEFPNHPFPEQSGSAEAMVFAGKLPRIVESLLFVSPPGAVSNSYMEGVGGEDLHNLNAVAVDIAYKGGKGSGTVIRVINGATEKMPFRGISYVIPALEYMQNIQDCFPGEKIDPPQLQVISANHIGASLNGMDYDTVFRESKKFTALVSDLIGKYYPRLAGSVVFLEDTAMEKDAPLQKELQIVSEVLKVSLSPEILGALREKRNNGAGDIYGAAHSVMHDRDMAESLTPIDGSQPQRICARNIISIGGFQENIFYRIRQAIKPQLGTAYNEVRTLQFFTRHRVPPYLMARGRDLSIDEVLEKGIDTSKIAQTAQFDIEYMQRMLSKRKEY